MYRHTGKLLAAAMLAGCASLEERSTTQAPPNDWSFLEYTKNFESAAWPSVKDQAVPVGPAISVGPQGFFVRGLEEELQKIPLIYDVESTEQLWCLPLDKQAAYSLERYCQEAETLLEETFPRAEHFKRIWTPITTGENYTADFNHRAFLCNRFFGVRTITGTHREDPKENFSFDAYRTMEGSFNLSFIPPNSYAGQSLIIIGAGETALVAPFSEMVPDMTASANQKYATKESIERYILVGEAFQEAVSYLCGIELTRRLQLPRGKERIDALHERILNLHQERYGLVPAAKELMPNLKAARIIMDDVLDNGFDAFANIVEIQARLEREKSKQ